MQLERLETAGIILTSGKLVITYLLPWAHVQNVEAWLTAVAANA
jgi:hypothetical protein